MNHPVGETVRITTAEALVRYLIEWCADAEFTGPGVR